MHTSSCTLYTLVTAYKILAKSVTSLAQSLPHPCGGSLKNLSAFARVDERVEVQQQAPCVAQLRFALAWMYYCMGKVQWDNGLDTVALECLHSSYELDAHMRHFPSYKKAEERRQARASARSSMHGKESRGREVSCKLPSRRYTRTFQSNTKYLSQKWDHYLPLYDKIFAPLRQRGLPISLLEIGVNNGGSLETWKRYFPKQSEIIGVDINPICEQLEFSEGISFHLGSATDWAFIDNRFGDKQFDVIIDDGSHVPHDVVATFNIMFPRLKWGGLYIVEDTSTAYWHCLGASINSQRTQIAFFQSLVHGVNFMYVEKKDHEGLGHKCEYFQRLSEEVASITFYANVIVIEKYAKKRVEPLSEILSQGIESTGEHLRQFERYTKDSPVLQIYKA